MIVHPLREKEENVCRIAATACDIDRKGMQGQDDEDIAIDVRLLIRIGSCRDEQVLPSKDKQADTTIPQSQCESLGNTTASCSSSQRRKEHVSHCQHLNHLIPVNQK